MSEQQQIAAPAQQQADLAEQHAEMQRIREIFADLEKKQPDILDDTAKSVIERVATFLAILFGVIALGGTFPPAFLVGRPWAKVLVLGILVLYLLSLGAAMWALQPRNYSEYSYNLTRLSHEWKRLLGHKKRWTRAAGLLFALGTIALAALIASIIWPV